MRSWAGPSPNPPPRRKSWANAPTPLKPNCAKGCAGFPPAGTSSKLQRWSRLLRGVNVTDRNAAGRGKLYDLTAGLPLILWFGYSAINLRPDLAADARALLDAPGSLLANLRFFALFTAMAFNLLLIYLVVVRTQPVRRASGIVPRLCGFAGTFLGVGILHLKPLELSLFWQSVAAALVFAGTMGSLIVLAKLGKSFAIMPEARVLVTAGPYAWAR